ncbi:hypothetical protein [Nocardioides houyundeii]|uniref:hypothetical protein n=1 Tax=Nocardioides houyundeii TaxID=2045452 RepID=UPI0013154F08|nr:hypothetical protein [Nocardioides houyundeii]
MLVVDALVAANLTGQAAVAAAELVDQVVKELNARANELRDNDPTRFEQPDFGASWAGQNLGTHGTKAQNVVMEDLIKFADELEAYRLGILESRKDEGETDQYVVDTFRAFVVEGDGGQG